MFEALFVLCSIAYPHQWEPEAGGIVQHTRRDEEPKQFQASMTGIAEAALPARQLSQRQTTGASTATASATAAGTAAGTIQW